MDLTKCDDTSMKKDIKRDIICRLKDCKIKWNHVIYAIENNSIKCLELFYGKGEKDKEFQSFDISSENLNSGGNRLINIAVIKGKVECLRLFYKWGLKGTNEDIFDALMHKKLDCLKILHENNCPWHHSSMYRAIVSHDLKILEYVCDNNPEIDKKKSSKFSSTMGNVRIC